MISFTQESKQIDDFTSSILVGNFITCCSLSYKKLYLNGCLWFSRDYNTDLYNLLIINIIKYNYISKEQNHVIIFFPFFSLWLCSWEVRDPCDQRDKVLLLYFLCFSLGILSCTLLHLCSKYFSTLFSTWPWIFNVYVCSFNII